MARWYLVWILSIQTHNNNIAVREPVYELLENKSECLYSIWEKELELIPQLGTEYFKLLYHDSNGLNGGILIGVSIGCEMKYDE